ncbi:uncharacterized protein CG5098 [Culicoides brevitarsis]|uniref:uncharacterized protein CG5098 n=1 Tax=Culicoides brevitarsis TaxID=469753 RepID=UPI00307C0B16
METIEKLEDDSHKPADDVEQKLQEMFNGVSSQNDEKLNKKDKIAKSTINKKGIKTKKKLKKKETPISKMENVPQPSKFKGPYIQLRQNISTVVNFPINDDEVEKHQSKQKGFNKFVANRHEKNHLRGMHASTLSVKYDDQTTDHTWICIFCKKGPHKDRLGDLFGPYIIESEPKSEEYKKKKKISELTFIPEMWTHEKCAVMTCGVYICGNKIIGLEEAATLSQSQKCSYCQDVGATIQCLRRGCTNIGHVTCFKTCSLSDNFQYYCIDHTSLLN